MLASAIRQEVSSNRSSFSSDTFPSKPLSATWAGCKQRFQNVVPALAFFLLFVIVACWFLAEITFFFDRYRIPLLTCVVLLSLTTTYAPESDHFYRVELGHSLPALLRPSVLVADHKKQGHKRLIAVATAGGGIQAAAWTARVLRGLEEECAHQSSGACDVRDSIVVISGVSGGSLGATAYARSFAPDLDPVSSDTAVTNAETSAVDARSRLPRAVSIASPRSRSLA